MRHRNYERGQVGAVLLHGDWRAQGDLSQVMVEGRACGALKLTVYEVIRLFLFVCLFFTDNIMVITSGKVDGGGRRR